MSPPSRTEKRKQRTRQKIIRIAIELFQRQGFPATTMDQIASEADVARKTLYNHFAVKEAIVDAYVRDESMALAKATLQQIMDRHPETAARLLAALDKTYAWVETHPELTGICFGYRMKNMWHGNQSEKGETGTQGLLAEILRKGQQAGEIRKDIPMRQEKRGEQRGRLQSDISDELRR